MSARIDEESDEILIKDQPTADTWTIAGWHKTVDKKSGADRYLMAVAQRTDGDAETALGWNTDDVHRIGNGLGGNETIDSTDVPMDGEWYYTFIRYDGSVPTVGWWDDANSQWVTYTSTDSSKWRDSPYAATYIGIASYGQWFNGKFAYYRLWSGRELTNSELKTEKDNGDAQNTTNLVGDWPLAEDGSDQSGNDNHLTTNTTTFDTSDYPDLPYGVNSFAGDVASSSSSVAGSVALDTLTSETVTDDFNRADEELINSSNWEYGPQDPAPQMSITNKQVKGEISTAASAYWVGAGNWGLPQKSKVEMGADHTQTFYTGVCVLANSTGLYHFSDKGDGQFRLSRYKADGDEFTTLNDHYTTSLVAGESIALKVELDNNNDIFLTAFIKGLEAFTVTDDSSAQRSSGYPGIFTASTSSYVDNWEGTDYAETNTVSGAPTAATATTTQNDLSVESSSTGSQPVVQSIEQQGFDEYTNPLIVALPQVVNKGDLLILFISITGSNPNLPISGWTTEATNYGERNTVLSRIADGSEGGDTLAIDLPYGGYESVTTVYRVTDWEGSSSGIEVSAFAADSLSPSWGSADTLWITADLTFDSYHDYDVMSYPDTFKGTTFRYHGDSEGGSGIATGYTVENTDSKNQGVYDYTEAPLGSNVLVAVRPSLADTTEPSFAQGPSVSNVSDDTFSIKATPDEDVDYYGVVVSDGASAPTSTEVKNGQSSGGGTPIDSANTFVAGNIEGELQFTGLSKDTAYDVYSVAEDMAANLQSSPVKNDVTTESVDTLAPAFVSGPTISNPTTDGLTVEATIDESGELYSVALPNGAAAPNSGEVKNGTGANGVAAEASNAISASASTATTHELATLKPDTPYDIYTVAEDSLGNLADAPVFNEGRTDTLPALSNASVASLTANTATVSVTTDKAGGTMYYVLTGSSNQPSSAQLRNGNDEEGNNAAASGSDSVNSPSTQSFSASGLTRDTTYYAHFVHRNASGDDSSVVTSSSFKTSKVASEAFMMGDFGLDLLD